MKNNLNPVRTAGYSDFFPDVPIIQKILITVIGEGYSDASTALKAGGCLMEDVRITQDIVEFGLTAINPITGIIHSGHISIDISGLPGACSLTHQSTEFIIALDLIKPSKEVTESRVFVAPHCLIFAHSEVRTSVDIKVNTRSPLISTLSDNNLHIEIKTDADNYIFTDKKAEGLISINGEKADAGNFRIEGVGNTLVLVSKPHITSEEQ